VGITTQAFKADSLTSNEGANSSIKCVILSGVLIRRNAEFKFREAALDDLSKEQMKFSAGHFTIFSATQRENLHGHNFTVGAIFKARITDNGIVCDYGILKKTIMNVCNSLNEYFLLPTDSAHLQITKDNGLVVVKFGNETLQFLERDVKLLHVINVTVEELSGWALNEIRHALPKNIEALMLDISVRVASGPGQGATARWVRTEVP
jgi:6-pyruvoyltetrahydropterin/6-carboxytetrahydropterin synthase